MMPINTPHIRRAIGAALAATVLVAGCAGSSSDLEPDPPQPARALRPDLMAVDPDPAAPGELVSLTFPEQTMRGIAFVLQRRIDGGWETSHLMTSNANGVDYMDTAPVDTEAFDVIDVGIGGPGPDSVRLPDGLAAGEYRICTDNAGDEFCAQIQIAQ